MTFIIPVYIFSITRVKNFTLIYFPINKNLQLLFYPTKHKIGYVNTFRYVQHVIIGMNKQIRRQDSQITLDSAKHLL